jgi:ribosomal-protein-alanine N-acetyltransferase
MAKEIDIRPWKMEDLNDLVKCANNPNIASNLTDKFPFPYGMKDGINFIKLTMEKDPPEIMAISYENKNVGTIGLHPMDDIYRMNAELGYWIAEPYWGMGIASEAIVKMVKYGFETFELDRIFARPFGSNIASQRVLEKAGFNLEAHFDNTLIKNGVLESQLYYGIRKNNVLKNG